MARSRLHRRYARRKMRSNPDDASDPPLLTELAEFVGPGFGGFAATRLLTRVAATQIAQRKPSWAKHAGAAASIGAFLAAWFLAHRWKLIRAYHKPIVVGSAIAALQSLIQIYIPKIGWMVADASPDLAVASPVDDAHALVAGHANLQITNDDPNEYTYNDSFDRGRYPTPGETPPIVDHPAGTTSIPGDLSDLALDDAIGQNSNLGVFTRN